MKAEKRKTARRESPFLEPIMALLKNLAITLKGEQVMLTGSFALAVHGFLTTIKDIDIRIVNPTEETLEMLKRYKEESPAPWVGELKYPTENTYSFRVPGFEDYTVDVFVVSCKEQCLLHGS